MLTLNNRFSLDSDRYQWILVESYAGKDKDGNDKAMQRQTYHPNLDLVASYIVEQDAKLGTQFNELLNGIRQTKTEMAEILKQATSPQ